MGPPSCIVAFIEHDVPLLMSWSNRAAMDVGQVIPTGTPTDVGANPRAAKAHLGGSLAATECSITRARPSVSHRQRGATNGPTIQGHRGDRTVDLVTGRSRGLAVVGAATGRREAREGAHRLAPHLGAGAPSLLRCTTGPGSPLPPIGAPSRTLRVERWTSAASVWR